MRSSKDTFCASLDFLSFLMAENRLLRCASIITCSALYAIPFQGEASGLYHGTLLSLLVRADMRLFNCAPPARGLQRRIRAVRQKSWTNVRISESHSLLPRSQGFKLIQNSTFDSWYTFMCVTATSLCIPTCGRRYIQCAASLIRLSIIIFPQTSRRHNSTFVHFISS